MVASLLEQMDTKPIAFTQQCVSAGEEQDWNTRSLSDTFSIPCVSLWTYQETAVVLGSSQRGQASGPHAIGLRGMEVVVRMAGGGAVLTGPWMSSASIVLPYNHRLVRRDPVETYRWLGEIYASVLCDLGMDARALAPEEARELQRRPVREDLNWACYGGLSPWEVVVGQRKIVGLAQVRRRTGVLLVAGLLVAAPDWKLLCRAMGRPQQDADRLEHLTISCADKLPSVPDQADLLSRLSDAFGLAIRG
jgi:lipoate-protein ligase A